jgi:hypothetical protein
MEVKNKITVGGEENAFARRAKLQRSPVSKQLDGSTRSTIEGTPVVPEEQLILGLNLLFTPKTNSNKAEEEQQGLHSVKTRATEVKNKVDVLYEYIKDRSNVHHRIRELVISIKKGMTAVEREQDALEKRAEIAEIKLKEMTAKSKKEPETPMVPSQSRASKRDRETPGEEETPKKQKEDVNEAEKKDGDNSGWRTIRNRSEKVARKKKEKEKEYKSNKTNGKPKPKSHRERTKGDALIVEVKGKMTYAALLRKVRADPELKELGENVVKARRTQRGEMLFELKKDPTVKSSAFKELVEKSLGEEASVRALSLETVIECRNLDEITTVDELRIALQTQCDLGGQPMTIRMRKGYSGTQTATIRLALSAANKLLETGKVKVGWSVCSLKTIPPVPKQMERCFKCMGFGHQARNCKGPDRSKRCRKCGDEGHFAMECTQLPRCMLCTPEEGNDHATGGFKCLAYKKATACQK